MPDLATTIAPNLQTTEPVNKAPPRPRRVTRNSASAAGAAPLSGFDDMSVFDRSKSRLPVAAEVPCDIASELVPGRGEPKATTAPRELEAPVQPPLVDTPSSRPSLPARRFLSPPPPQSEVSPAPDRAAGAQAPSESGPSVSVTTTKTIPGDGTHSDSLSSTELGSSLPAAVATGVQRTRYKQCPSPPDVKLELLDELLEHLPDELVEATQLDYQLLSGPDCTSEAIQASFRLFFCSSVSKGKSKPINKTQFRAIHQSSFDKPKYIGPSTTSVAVATRNYPQILWGRGKYAQRISSALKDAIARFPDDQEIANLLDDMLLRAQFTYRCFNKEVSYVLFIVNEVLNGYMSR